MLSKDELIKIGRDETVKMMGIDLVKKNKELCCGSYGVFDDGLFHFVLGMDTKKTPYKMGDETPMEYRALVTIDPETGKVIQDYENSILPN